MSLKYEPASSHFCEVGVLKSRTGRILRDTTGAIRHQKVVEEAGCIVCSA
jgi:hypothetical protein